MNKKIRVLLLGFTLILLCFCFMIGATYALYTDQFSVSNHLDSGSLNITLIRDKLTKYELNEKGYLEENIDDQNISFNKQTSENIFGFKKEEKFVPLSSYKADLIISNCSDVAFGYYVEIKLNDTSYNELSKQIMIKVEGESIKEVLLSEGVLLGSINDYLGIVEVGESVNFSVTASFLDLDNNNDAMNKKVDFDLIVHAVQVTKEK